MPEIMPDERPFYWTCGKCRGAGLYRDDDRLVGDFSIVCPICGNRYYGDVGGKVRGLAPVKIYYTPEIAPPPFGASHFVQERTANIVTGPAGSGARTTEKKEESMPKTKIPCANCKRKLTVVADHCCYACYNAGKGLDGEEKAAARAAIKEKIESGRLKRGGGRRGPRPKGRIAPATPPEKTDKRKRACVNCGRVRFIYREDLCGLCCGAAADLADDERAVALEEIKRKIESGEVGTGKRRSPFGKPVPAGRFEVGGLVPGGAEGMHAFAHRPLLPGEKIVAARVVEGTPEIFISFADERDRKIYDVLIVEANRLRRTPEQQILYMLQDWFDTAAAFDRDAAKASGR